MPLHLTPQAVHMIFKWTADEAWGDPTTEPRGCKLVFIGKGLDHAALRAGFAGCVVSPELAQRQRDKRARAADICAWARAALPAAHAGTSVGVDEVRCAKPACPIETVLTVQMPKPKQFTLRKPLASVAQAEVAELMAAWGAMLERGRAVQAWAEQALPKPVAGSRVLVDEVEGGRDIHTSERLETHLHVLATPPWSMKVLRPLDDVTQQNVTELMALAQLCGSTGVPSVR